MTAAASWNDAALDQVVDFLTGKSMTETFFGTDAREYAHAHGLVQPKDTRAWGGVMRRAEKAGFIEHAGFGRSPNPASHSSPVAIWKRAC